MVQLPVVVFLQRSLLPCWQTNVAADSCPEIRRSRRLRMLSYADCEAMSELTTREITAIARHMKVHEIIAVELGASLCRTPGGRELIERLLLQSDEYRTRNGR